MGMRYKDKLKYTAVSAAMLIMCAGTAMASTTQTTRVRRTKTPTYYIAEPVKVERLAQTETVAATEIIAEPVEETKATFTDAETEMLARIAMAEAEGEGVEGKALVIRVILNRVQDADFPDSIEAVIFQKHQFATVNNGGRYWTKEPDAGCYEAIEMVESGWDESQGALFFESTHNTSDWHKNHLAYLFQKGNHIFYTRKGTQK